VKDNLFYVENGMMVPFNGVATLYGQEYQVVDGYAGKLAA
jgi:hypothetical protein